MGEKIPPAPNGWTNPMGPDPGLFPDIPITVPDPATGTPPVGSGTAVATGTPDVATGTQP